MIKGFEKGHIPWNKNKSWSIEIKRKMSLAKLGKIRTPFH